MPHVKWSANLGHVALKKRPENTAEPSGDPNRLRPLPVIPNPLKGDFPDGGVMFFAQRSLLYMPSHSDQLSTLRPWLDDGETIGYSSEVSNPHTVWR